MLKINNKLKKCRFPLLLIFISVSGVFLFQYLTFIPRYSHAKSISTIKPSIKTVSTWNELEYMQQMTLEACNSVDTPAAKNSDGSINANVPTKQLKDSRDGKIYWIAKLADGNCWMTQNLAIDLTNKDLTPNDTDISNSVTLPKADSWSTSDNENISWYIYASGEGHNSYGGYYSWQAATADTAPKNNDSNSWPESPSSICPRGWRLPSNNSGAPTFAKLTSIYGINSGAAGSNILRNKPLYFVYSGRIYDGGLQYGGDEGFYWNTITVTPVKR